MNFIVMIYKFIKVIYLSGRIEGKFGMYNIVLEFLL